jgi:hypothetical protein
MYHVVFKQSGVSILIMPSKLKNLTYPHECACQIAEVLGLDDFQHLRIAMNEEHKALFSRKNRIQILDEFVTSSNSPQLHTILKERIKDANTRELVTETLNEPTLEAFKVLEIAGLPRKDTGVVFNTTATANSGNDNAIMAAFKILGIDHKDSNIVFENCSTCTQTGFTGVSYVRPKHTPVKFNPNALPDEWELVSYDLGKQLYQISTGIELKDETPILHDKYSNIYHWGCISQNWLKNPLGHYVSSWKLHEKWNLMFTIAMMWHAVATLRQGGQLCLKVRVVRSAETLGLVSLLSALFDSVQLLDNARQQCSFAIAIYSGFNASSELRLEMLNLLRRCMTFEPSVIFYNRIQREYESCLDTMVKVEHIREVMIKKRAETNTVYLACLDCAKQFLQRRNRRIMFDTALPLLIDTYGGKLGQQFFDSLMIACKNLTNQQQSIFVTVMDTTWMHDNV